MVYISSSAGHGSGKQNPDERGQIMDMGKEKNGENTENFKESKIKTEIVDYKRIFDNNPGEPDEPGKIKDMKDIKKDKRVKKEKRYILTFIIQSIICLIIIGSIIVTKYTSPNTFVSVSSTLNGLYKNNITLSDLNRIIDDKILNNDALSAFFNMSGK